jgi:hypothetical protein
VNTFVVTAPHKAFAVFPENNMPDGYGVYPEMLAAGQQKAQYPAFRFNDAGRNGDFSAGKDHKRNQQNADAGYREGPAISEK